MNSITRTIFEAYGLFRRLASMAQSPLLLAVRLYWGFQFMQAGWGKLHNLGHVAQYFTSLGIPAPGPTAVFVACVEFFGGVLLMLGLASRLTGLVLTGNMLVAYVTAERQALFSVFSDPGTFYQALPFTFLFVALLVLIFGPGWFAVDTWIAHRCTPHTAEQEQPPQPAHRDAA